MGDNDPALAYSLQGGVPPSERPSSLARTSGALAGHRPMFGEDPEMPPPPSPGAVALGAPSFRRHDAEADAERARKLLLALDKAQLTWYHVTTIIIAGAGFFTDAFDLFSIALLTRLLGRLYYQAPPTPHPAFDPSRPEGPANPRLLPALPGQLPIQVNAALSAVALVGTLVGQIVWGRLGDLLGRKMVYGTTLLLMTFGSIASALSFGHTPTAVLSTLCVFRFLQGFGIGGDYPLSATIMSEYSSTANRGAFIAAVFAMQGFGILFAAALSLAVSGIFLHTCPATHRGFDGLHPGASVGRCDDYAWRIILAFGALPALFTFYYRLKMPETARYTTLVTGDHAATVRDMARVLGHDHNGDAGKSEARAGGLDSGGAGAAHELAGRPSGVSPRGHGAGTDSSRLEFGSPVGASPVVLRSSSSGSDKYRVSQKSHAQSMAGAGAAPAGAYDLYDAGGPMAAIASAPVNPGSSGGGGHGGLGDDSEAGRPPRTAAGGPHTWREFLAWRSPRFSLQLMGTMLAWFLLDIAFYSQNLFQKDVLTAAKWLPAPATMNAMEETWAVARAQALIALAATVPGYWVTVCTIESLGRWRLQVIGFAAMGLCLALLAGLYDVLIAASVPAFVTLYALTFFFANFGPNSTTFIVPAELFPARFRATCHGVSAAAGKAGAIVGAFGFLYLAQPSDAALAAPYPPGLGMKPALWILAACTLAGLVVSVFFVPETAGKSLEELSGEHETSTAAHVEPAGGPRPCT